MRLRAISRGDAKQIGGNYILAIIMLRRRNYLEAKTQIVGTL